jgi:hypothetical protein
MGKDSASAAQVQQSLLGILNLLANHMDIAIYMALEKGVESVCQVEWESSERQAQSLTLDPIEGSPNPRP